MSNRPASPPGGPAGADLLDGPGLAWLRATVMALLTGLAAQFALGIYANLYVSFPAQSTSRGGMAAMGAMTTVMDHVGLAAHLVLGFLLVAGGIAAVVFAAQARLSAALWLAGIGLAGLVGAGVAGLIFVLGNQSNAASFVMAIGFLVSFSCYFAELSVTRG